LKRGRDLLLASVVIVSLTVSILLAASPGRAAREPSVLFPPDLTLSLGEKIKVLVFQPGGAVPLPVSVNGIEQPQLEGETFLKGEISLYAGMNIIRVGQKVIRVYLLKNAKMEELRLSGDKEGEMLTYRAFRLHPALDDGCEGCHKVEGDKLAAKDLKEACYGCHNNFEKGEGDKKVYVHAPVAGGECTGCHDPHFSTRAKLQKLEKGCNECHDPFPATGTVHYPVKEKECTGCHSPHAGPAPKQLVRPGNALCLGCHEASHAQHRKAEVKGTLTRIPEDFPRDKDELLCLGCHLPHQSAERRLFRMNQGKLCQTCHKV
jgi:predicted CXXCH cytochrome family protein